MKTKIKAKNSMGEYNWKYSTAEQWKVYQHGWETDEDKLS